MSRMDVSTPKLESRLTALSGRLCTSLEAAIRGALVAIGECSGDPLRPVLITSRLGLDKSLASRVVRAIGADDPIRALHGIPTPQGLALVARATATAGASPEQVAALEDASAAYGELLAEFSGGRTDLEATLVGWIPEQRERAERDARRSVFRGMTTLSGIRTSAVYHSLYLVPAPGDDGNGCATGSEDDRVNSLIVTLRQDLRRLRSGARLHFMSMQKGPVTNRGHSERSPAQDVDSSQDRFTLDGAPLLDDPGALLLGDLCSHPLPQLELQHSGPSILVSVHPDALDVNEFATIGMGWKTKGHFQRYAAASRRFESLTVEALSPTEALVVDLFIHEDLAYPHPPFASSADVPGQLGPRIDPMALPPAELQAAPCPINLDAHPSGLSSPDVRACGAIAENACREAGVILTEFSKYRFRIAFPTPTEQLTVWWELPEPFWPTGHSERGESVS